MKINADKRRTQNKIRVNLCNMKSVLIRAAGFTLIEVLGAIVVFAILIALTMQVVAGSLVISKNTEIASRNVVLCNRIMDEIKAQVLGRSTDPFYAFGWDVDYAETATAFPVPGPNAGFIYTVSDPDFPAVLIRDIAVTVWYDEDGDSVLDSNEKGITFNTRIARMD